MLPALRVLTVHPALVHVPLGAAPILLVAYALAAWRRSSEWARAGDVALVIAVPFTLLAFAFGLVSNAVAQWPGGLHLWRVAHLVLGAITCALYLGLAGLRWFQRRQGAPSGWVSAAGAALVALAVGATGWIGGEVLVFHAGIAVRGGADGALSPPLGDHPPEDLVDVMGQLRGAWGGAQGSLAEMIAQHPTADGFKRITEDAQRLESLSAWLDGHPPPGLSDEDVAALQFMAGTLGERARALGQAAGQSSLPRCAKALAAVSATCAGCHAQLRWKSKTGVER